MSSASDVILIVCLQIRKPDASFGYPLFLWIGSDVVSGKILIKSRSSVYEIKSSFVSLCLNKAIKIDRHELYGHLDACYEVDLLVHRN